MADKFKTGDKVEWGLYDITLTNFELEYLLSITPKNEMEYGLQDTAKRATQIDETGFYT